MAALPCDPWVRLTVADAFGDSPASLAAAEAAAAGEENDAIAFALSPQEAAQLRAAGIASGQAVALNDVVTAVAVGPRTPGFGGSAQRLKLRFSETFGAAAAGKGGPTNASRALWADARSLDGGRPLPAPQQYKAVAVSPAAVKNASAAASSSSQAQVQAAVNPDPNGLLVVLTAADPRSALAARTTAREPHLGTEAASSGTGTGGGEAKNRATPVSVDATAPNARVFTGPGFTGHAAPVPVPRRTQRGAVGADEAAAKTAPLSITSASTTSTFVGEAFLVGEALRMPAGGLEGAERRRLRLRRRLLSDAAGE
jgi:hypothetical protein